MTIQTGNNISEMLTIIKTLREQQFPDLPEEIVLEIVKLEERYFDNRPEVRNRIERLVDAILQQGNGQ
jgi:hypothetical protein